TSSAVKDKHIKDISSATLRNELNALEAMGFLKQIHTSSGRVPTGKGYKYYVENLLRSTKAEVNNLDLVKNEIKGRSNSISDIIDQIAGIISKATNYPTVVHVNGYDTLLIEKVNVIQLISNQALVLIYTKNGVIHNTINVICTEKSCEDASRFITKKFFGKTIGFMAENMSCLKGEMQSEIRDFQLIVDNIVSLLKELSLNGTMNIKREGSAKLLTSSEGSLGQTKNILTMLEDEDRLKALVETEGNDDISLEAFMEDENGGLDGCSVVKAPIIVSGKQIASVGVLGPQRMDYMQVASALRLVMAEVEIFDKQIEEGERK
ncbi:MAG: hypothetical protein RR400_03555, partial [Clostridia bacterium]